LSVFVQKHSAKSAEGRKKITEELHFSSASQTIQKRLTYKLIAAVTSNLLDLPVCGWWWCKG